jgi:hypothetical protein
MARVAALGEGVRVQAYGLAGALVVAAEDADAVRAGWRRLPGDVAVVILTPAAAAALDLPGAAPDGPLPVVLP